MILMVLLIFASSMQSVDGRRAQHGFDVGAAADPATAVAGQVAAAVVQCFRA